MFDQALPVGDEVLALLAEWDAPAPLTADLRARFPRASSCNTAMASMLAVQALAKRTRGAEDDGGVRLADCERIRVEKGDVVVCYLPPLATPELIERTRVDCQRVFAGAQVLVSAGVGIEVMNAADAPKEATSA